MADASITANAGGIRKPGDPAEFTVEIAQGMRDQLADFKRFQELLWVRRCALFLRVVLVRLR